MKKILKFILCFPYYFLLHFINAFHRVKTSHFLSGLSSCFPEEKRKCRLIRFLDFYVAFVKNRSFSEFYYLYGFDLKGKNDKSKYLSENEFFDELYKVNHVLSLKGIDYLPYNTQNFLLRNKIAFFHYLNLRKVPTPTVYGFIENKKVFNLFHEEDQSCVTNNFPCVVKDATGQCGSFVKILSNKENWELLRNSLTNSLYLIQEKILQIDELSKFYNKSINTIRIVTFYNNGEPIVFSSVLRIGTSISRNVDNYSKGGIVVGINDNGELRDFGIMKPSYGKVSSIHPDTKLPFKSFKLPYYENVVSNVCKAHLFFSSIPFIGWDVAVTKNGPIIIEANENWEISLMQAANGPLKEKFNRLLKTMEENK